MCKFGGGGDGKTARELKVVISLLVAHVMNSVKLGRFLIVKKTGYS